MKFKRSNEYGRIIEVTEIPYFEEIEFPFDSMKIQISYVGEGNVHKGVALDSVIIPAIVKALTEKSKED